MKKIKINFCGFWNSFQKDDNLFYHILSRHFQIEISDKPDFVIVSNRGRPFEYMKYDCVRLMFMGENLSPDFTTFDYVIGFDHMTFGDRYYRLPFAFYFNTGVPWRPEKLTADRAEAMLREKTEFCNFIYRHPSSNSVRERLFSVLNEYKPVVSPGSYLNNTGGSGCSWSEKYRYLRTSKFTIACDSVSYPGFMTEKVIQPLEHHSVPIYFGNPLVTEDLNEKAIVLCRDASDDAIREAADRVRYLNEHDDAYLEMLTQFPLRDENTLERKYAELEAFLVHIFSQDPVQAGRRIRYFCADRHSDYLKKCMDQYASDSFLYKTRRVARNVLKKK